MKLDDYEEYMLFEELNTKTPNPNTNSEVFGRTVILFIVVLIFLRLITGA